MKPHFKGESISTELCKIQGDLLNLPVKYSLWLVYLLKAQKLSSSDIKRSRSGNFAANETSVSCNTHIFSHVKGIRMMTVASITSKRCTYFQPELHLCFFTYATKDKTFLAVSMSGKNLSGLNSSLVKAILRCNQKGHPPLYKDPPHPKDCRQGNATVVDVNHQKTVEQIIQHMKFILWQSLPQWLEP